VRRIALIVCVALTTVAPVGGKADARPVGDTQVFANVPAPGAPEGIYVTGGIVYVGTHATVRGNGGEGPSKIFEYDLTGTRLGDEIIITGQNEAATHGILGMARDSAGRLYVLDRNPSRVLRIDPTTHTQEVYSTIPDLHPCALNPPPCSPTTLDEASFPDYPAFDAAGNLYLTDLQAATIFRVPPGGGTAQIWFQESRLDGIFGANGVAVREDQGKLYFAMTVSQEPAFAGLGLIYTLPLVAAPTVADLEVFHTFAQPADGPDGIAFGASGNLYAALAGSNQVAVVGPTGTEVTRFPSPVDNAISDAAYDLPASIGFNGNGSILLTNQSFFVGNPDHWKVLDIWVNDTARPLVEPFIS
jgi:DNA-binding beta-propeller fold protein YncE